jgi:hypothetical protein
MPLQRRVSAESVWIGSEGRHASLGNQGEARQIIEARWFDAEIVSSVLTDTRFGLIKALI